MITQLILPVLLRESANFSNFVTGKNDVSIACLRQMSSGLGENNLYLWGHSGTGRTHLLQAACQLASVHRLAASYLPLSELVEHSPTVLEELESFSLICIDDLQSIAGHGVWERAIFNLYNQCQMTGCRLVIVADASPKQVKIQLPDLMSRLESGLIFQIMMLDDEDKLSVLKDRAGSRGLELGDEVGKFLLHHQSRDLSVLFGLLDKLDKASLAAQRRLTVPFVKEVINVAWVER